MFENHLSEYNNIKNYQNEYFKLIDIFKNIRTDTIYFRYFNINSDLSVFEKQNKSTYDNFTNNIVYDVYEYTPGLEIGQVTDNLENDQNKGVTFKSNLNIVIYTIKEPKIDDLVMFPYIDNNDQIFKVSDIETSLYNNTNRHIRITLNYAGILNMSKLNIHNHYVYMNNNNIDMETYKKIISEAKIINDNIEVLNNNYFDEKEEMFFYYFNDKKLICLDTNKQLYNLFKDKVSNNKFFNYLKIPYGVVNYNNYNNKILDISKRYHTEILTYDNRLIEDSSNIEMFELYKYNEKTVLFDTLKLLKLFKGFNYEL